MVRDFDEIIAVAAGRRGGMPALEEALAATPALPAAVVAAVGDDRILAEMSRWIFYAGFSPRVVDARWPGFEAAFSRFDPQTNAAMDEERLAALSRDRNIVRNRAKIPAVRINARLLLDLATPDRSAAGLIAQWPDEDYAGLLTMLQQRGSHLSGHAAMRFLRAIGKPAFILTDDVVAALARERVILRRPRGREALATVQAAFNIWSRQSGRDLTQVSRILAMTVGEVRPPRAPLAAIAKEHRDDGG